MKKTYFNFRLLRTLGASALVFSVTVPAQAVLIDNLISYWQFDENLTDSQGGYTTTQTGGGTEDYAVGKFGKAINLDGGSEQIEVTEAGQYDFGAAGNGFSISTWFQVNSFDTNWQALIAKGEGREFRVHRSSGSNKLAFNAGSGGDLTNEAGVNDGGWHHVAAIHDPSGTGMNTLYIDGVPVSGLYGNVVDNDKNLMIGENPDNQNREWAGLVDDVAIWGRPLEAGEVASIWNDGNGASIASLTAVPSGGSTLPMLLGGVAGLLILKSKRRPRYC